MWAISKGERPWEKLTLHRRVCHLRRWEWPWNMMWLAFKGHRWFYKLMNGRIILTILGKGQRFQELGHCPFWSLLKFTLELPWCPWVCYLVCWHAAVSKYWYSNSSGSQLVHHIRPIGSNQFMSCSLAMAFFQRSLSSCPFPSPLQIVPFLLFQED